MKTIESSLAHQFATHLRKAILNGEIAGGEQLKQDHLAKQFNSSHVPIREALQLLIAEGLAERIPRCGVIVKKLDLADVIEVVEMRVVLESLALELSIPNLTHNILLEAERFLKLGESETNIDNLIIYNWQFHRVLYSGIHKPRLMASIEELWIHAERYMRFVWSKLDYNTKSHQEHHDILAACKRNDIPTAVTLLKNHISEAGDNAEKLLSSI